MKRSWSRLWWGVYNDTNKTFVCYYHKKASALRQMRRIGAKGFKTHLGVHLEERNK